LEIHFNIILSSTPGSSTKSTSKKKSVQTVECTNVCADIVTWYIGQTERSFYKRYKEHFREFKLGGSKSDFAKDLLDNGQSMCQIENFINIPHIKKNEDI